MAGWLIVILGISLIFNGILYIRRVKTISYNNHEKEKYQQELSQLEEKKKILKEHYQEQVEKQEFLVNQTVQLYQDKIESEKSKINSEFQNYAKNLSDKRKALDSSYNAELNQLEELHKTECNNLKKLIEDFQEKRAAIIAMEQAQEKVKNEEKFFSLQMPETAQQDIDMILELSKKITNPQAFYKIVWSEYYQKPTKALISRVLGDKTVSGIYKITCLTTGKIYIGRSVNVGERWIQHIKSALEIGSIAKTQLYQEMKDNKIYNFTFELLEECDKDKLKEREKFYILLYKTNEWGMNENSGG